MKLNIIPTVLVLTGFLCGHSLAAPYPERFVWLFGWGLGKDSDVTELTKVLETASRSGLNGAMFSTGLDTLCKQSPDYFRRLEDLRKASDRLGVDLIPAIFSVGYGGGALGHNRHLAEGVPVENAPFVVRNGEARLATDDTTRLVNGGFEEHTGHKFKGHGFVDQPGEISFVDLEVKHSGQASLRLENFRANSHGHGRVSQEVRLRPHRCYRVSLWVKTEGLQPASALQMLALAQGRELAPRTFGVPSTTDWRKLTMLINSLDYETAQLYAGLWGGRSGKVWLDDWTIEEVGPLNVLRRPGTPVTVQSEDGAITFAEGKDFAPLQDANFSLYRQTQAAPPLRVLAGGRIQDGQELRVSWYHPMVVHDSQVTVCMGEPELYEIYDHEAKLLTEHLHPRRVMLNMDEIRMGGTCRACQGQPMGELLGACVKRQVESLRHHNPKVEVLIWSDMLDPHHNAHDNYYLVKGNFTNSWKYVPKDLTIAVWGGAPREKSLRFFADEGFQTLVACYYDADNLDEVKSWLDLAQGIPTVRGFMYTPWQKKYGLLPEFGKLLRR